MFLHNYGKKNCGVKLIFNMRWSVAQYWVLKLTTTKCLPGVTRWSLNDLSPLTDTLPNIKWKALLNANSILESLSSVNKIYVPIFLYVRQVDGHRNVALVVLWGDTQQDFKGKSKDRQRRLVCLCISLCTFEGQETWILRVTGKHKGGGNIMNMLKYSVWSLTST